MYDERNIEKTDWELQQIPRQSQMAFHLGFELQKGRIFTQADKS